MGFDRTRKDFWIRIASAILAVVGIGITTYLVYERFSGGLPTCVIGGGCSTVQKSEWSTVAGVPVALMGLLAYIALLVCALTPWQISVLGAFFVSLLGVLLSSWLTALELFQIHAICEWCVSSALVVVVAFGFSIARLVIFQREASQRPPAAS